MDEPSAQDQKPASDQPLTYEETPIIDPRSGEVTKDSAPTPESTPAPIPRKSEAYEASDVIPEAAKIFEPAPSASSETHEPSHAKPPSRSHIGTIFFVVILFGLGVWLSMQLRSFFAPTTSQDVVIPTSAPLPVVTPQEATQATSSATPDSSWVTYQVISGATRKAIAGVSYKLPASVSAPVCDGGSCPSQGTTLPGGTRFTVAARGVGQLLPDFRGAILTDATGKEFTMKQTIVGGVYAYEYIGNFTGRTGGGYTFTAMRGAQVPVNDTLAIEFNHFAPAGITTDFVKDDALFDTIIGTFTTNFPTPTIQAIFPTSTPVATTSGN